MGISDSLEQDFRKRTIGLVTADDFRKARGLADEAKRKEDLKLEEDARNLEENKKAEREAKRKMMRQVLSFAEDAEGLEQEEEEFVPKKRLTKNPIVDTSYLPDRTRDAALEKQRKELQAEWEEQQQVIKNEVSS